jgi:hypothetical protein
MLRGDCAALRTLPLKRRDSRGEKVLKVRALVDKVFRRRQAQAGHDGRSIDMMRLEAKYALLASQMRTLVVVANVPEEMRRKLELCLTCDERCPGIKKCEKK